MFSEAWPGGKACVASDHFAPPGISISFCLTSERAMPYAGTHLPKDIYNACMQSETGPKGDQ